MTNANRIMVDPLYNLPYSEKDWSNACSKINEEYSKQTKGIIMGVTIAEIFLLCVLTVFSFLIAIPLSIVVFETDPAVTLLFLPIPVFGLISIGIMIVGLRIKSVKYVFWPVGIPCIILLVFGLGWLLVWLGIWGMGETDREILENIEQKYTGKEVTLQYEQYEYRWNGEIVSGFIDSMEMEQVSFHGISTYDWAYVRVDGTGEEYPVYRKEGSDKLYVSVNRYEIDVLLEMEKVQ